ncbi:MerR family DNA-binding transcriptional regulator [Longibaculum muris]|nr:MerR family DNA-binding transcriptional regulator [Longibaculum muris]
MKKYTSGQFAKLANVTLRTIRYYDNEGLLKLFLLHLMALDIT